MEVSVKNFNKSFLCLLFCAAFTFIFPYVCNSISAQAADVNESSYETQSGFWEDSSKTKNKKAKRVTINKKKLKLIEGESFRLSASKVSSGQKIVFSSTNEDVVALRNVRSKKVDVVGVSSGTATITVKIRERNGLFYRTARTLRCKVTVGPEAISVKFKRATYKINCGEKKKLKYTMKPNNTTEVPTFYSSDPEKLKIDKNGKATALKSGVVKVTATLKNRTEATCTVLINESTY